MNAAVLTARAGSKSIRNKNVYPVLGKPLMAYSIQAALDSPRVEQIFVSTDGESIADVGRQMGCKIIWRPEELRGDHVNHGDVIKHAVEYMDASLPDLTNVVSLQGNTVMVDGELIDQALAILEEHADLDSVLTVWEAADDHPLRALQIVDGLLRPYGEANRDVSTERQSYPKAYYQDQGIFVFRKECVQRRDGPSPWWWMGPRCRPIVRNWVAGRDVHTLLDVKIAEWWLTQYPDIKKL